MTRILHTLGVFALIGAGVLFWLSSVLWCKPISGVDEILGCSRAIGESGWLPGHDASSHAPGASPLIVQAKAFASYLNPPERRDTPPMEKPAPMSNEPGPPIRPVAPSAAFRLCGTSFYANQPGRSMALIAEIGSPEGSERWVKEGSQMGHFVIHEIRPNGIVYRYGDQLREMAVETAAGPASIVQDIRPGSRRVTAALEDVGIVAPTPVGPNSIEISGN